MKDLNDILDQFEAALGIAKLFSITGGKAIIFANSLVYEVHRVDIVGMTGIEIDGDLVMYNPECES